MKSFKEGDEAGKPVKVVEFVATPRLQKPTWRQRLMKPANRRPLQVDQELLAFLQVEFMFRPRTADLLPQMAAKAKQFLSRFDTTEITWVERRDLIGNAVGAAMDVTQTEYDVRQHLRDAEQSEERRKQAALLKEGKVSSGSFFFPGTALPKS